MRPRSNIDSAPHTPHTPRPREGQPVRAAFQSRKTLADCVKENMTIANRRTYFQRIIFVAKHLESSKEFNKTLDNFFREKLAKAEKYSHGENISGLIVFYDGYSVHMLEGSEEALGPFFRMMSSKENERFFKKIVWFSADPPVLVETLTMNKLEDIELQCGTVLKRIYNLCKKVQDSTIDGLRYYEDERLDSSYNKLMPEIALIDALIATKYLPSISQMAGMYEAVPRFFNYDSQVWPIPFSYCPTNIFANDEYEVNLTFHKDPKN